MSNYQATDGGSTNNKQLCVAFVHQDDTAEVVVYDAQGDARTFTTTSDGEICFSGHKHGDETLLTPCFDEDGHHGTPETTCACGVDAPHLHAHYYHPSTCEPGGSKEDDAQKLSRVVLLPEKKQPRVSSSGGGESTPLLDASTSSGLSFGSTHSSGGRTAKSGRRRLHKLKHGDGKGHLTMDEETGDLYWEVKGEESHKLETVAQRQVHTSPLHFVTDKVRKSMVTTTVSSAINFLGSHFQPSHGVLKTTDATTTEQPASCQRMIQPPPLPPCCDSETGFCQLATVSDCCATGKCTAVPQFMPMELLMEEPELTADGDNGTIGRSQLHVQKICCSAEIPQINHILKPIEGVTNVAINVTTKMVYVDHDTAIVTAQSLTDTLNKALFGATLKRDAGAIAGKGVASYVRSTLKIVEPEDVEDDAVNAALSHYKSTQLESFVVAGKTIVFNHSPLSLPLANIVEYLEKEADIKTTIVSNGADDVVWDFPSYEEATSDQQIEGGEEEEKWPRPTVILSGLFWVVSMFSFLGGPFTYLQYIALLAVAFGIPGITMKAISTMKRMMFDSNCLMFFAAVGALAFQEYTEAAAVTFLFALSEWLEARATTRGRNALSAIVNLRPDFAWIIHPKTKEQLLIPASAVPVGAIVAVKTGDKIPCDGVVVEGKSVVDESSLTGESKPVRKIPKSLVSGGTVNCGHNHLMIQTTSTAENSAISRLVSLVEEAQSNRSETEKLVDAFARVYTPIVVLAALCMCTIPWFFGAETGKLWTYNGLVLIVVACPCALIISTPVTYVAGLAATAQRGVLIKGGAHLESLGLIKTLCFDKTGTLTQGSFALITLNVLGTKFTREEVLEYLVLMEERANHPLALAIVDGAKREGVSSPQGKKVTEHTFMAGEGLSGIIDGKQLYVGNSRLFNRLGLLDDIEEELENTIWNWESMAGTVGFMSIDGDLVCAYCVADEIRHESLEVVEALQKMGIDVHMLTGDNKHAAKAIGQMVGLKEEGINSDLLPEEKLKFITDMKGGNAGRTVLANPMGKRDLVCHVGDGVNDAPALAAADLGVAMGVGAALAMETANITLLDSNLKKLQFSLEMGRKVLWTIKENVAFSLIVKAVVLGFTLMGKVALWVAIVTDVGAMLCVTLNGMRLLPSSKIDVDEMGDIGNVSYKSQVSTASSES